MASRKTIQQMITFFTPLMMKSMRSDELESLEKTYFTTFKQITDKALMDAVYRYMEEEEYFPPKPAAIKRYVRGLKEDKHIQEMIDEYTCKLCGQRVSAISEGLCLDCAGFPPAPIYKRLKPPPPIKESGFQMEGRIKCSKCGIVTLCIRDSGKEPFVCRDCYTGISSQARAKRFKYLFNIPNNRIEGESQEDRIARHKREILDIR